MHLITQARSSQFRYIPYLSALFRKGARVLNGPARAPTNHCNLAFVIGRVFGSGVVSCYGFCVVSLSCRFRVSASLAAFVSASFFRASAVSVLSAFFGRLVP